MIPPIYSPRFSGLPVQTEYIDGLRFRLIREVSYRIKSGTFADHVSTVRVGYVSDFASVPRFFWRVFPPAGDGRNPYGIAALFHDWLYDHRQIQGLPCSRAEADAVFFEIMETLHISLIVRRSLYRAVRAFGWIGWNRRQPVGAPAK